MPCLENYGNGTWRVTISAGYDAKGKKKRLQRTIHVDPNKTEKAQRREVEKTAAALETDFSRHVLTDSRIVRLETAAAEYLAHKSISATTREWYRVMLDGRILPALGKYAVQDLTPAMLRRFFKDLELAPAGPRSKSGTLSGKSRKHYFAVLRAVLNFSVKSGYITVNPMAALDAPPDDTPEADFYEPEEWSALLDALDGLGDVMWTAYYYMALYTCCRPGELIGANWTDIHGDVFHVAHGAARVKGVGTVRTAAPKTQSSIRDIVIPAEVLALLKKWKAEQAAYRLKFGDGWIDSDAIFTADDGKRIDLSTPTQKFQKILKANGLRHINLYGLRHTGASILISSGRDVESVAAQLGHSTPVLTLSTYSHAFESAKRENAEVISKIISSSRRRSV